MATRAKRATGSGTDGERGDRSAVRLISDIAGDTTTLVRQELELFKQELLEAVTARLKAAAALAVAGVLGLFVIGSLGAAGAWALGEAMPMWAAYLVVSGTFVVLAGLGLAFARRRMKVPPMTPEETVRTVKEDVEWARAQLKR